MLPPETKRVWQYLKEQSGLAGFVLIGGTALAMRIAHRRSEDLDFVYPEPKLPRARLEAAKRLAGAAGFKFRQEQDEAAVQQFAEAGLEMLDYQQNFVVNDVVKVSFFAPERPLISVLHAAPKDKPRVATLDELFRSKCLVSAVRSKSRDWVDLYLLLREHGFSIHDFQQAFRDADVETQCATALSRLCSGIPQKDDEGYQHLLPNAPSLADIKAFFIHQRNRLEVESAEQALRDKNAGKPAKS